MTTLITRPGYHYASSHSDRLGVTLFFALALHAIAILGISFDLDDRAEPDTITSFEVTLVHSKSDEAPNKADYLAQANQHGDGTSRERGRPSSPFSNPLPNPEQGIAPQSRQAIAPPPAKQKKLQREVMTVQDSASRIHSRPEQIPLPVPPESVTAAQLFARSSEIARLSAEINKLKQAFQKEPHHTYVTGANAREYRYASYLDAWRAKVERIGNLNYPKQALRNNTSGQLLMDVAIKPDGSLHSIKILRSSGHRFLDEAAMRIVRMSAPFSPLPKGILQDTDVLHIPRVWQFRNDTGLFMSNG